MGKLYSLISALLLTVSATFAAAPDSYEWWFDHDVSSAQSGIVTGGKVDFQIGTSDLPKGIHYFNLRLAEGNGIYGPVYRKMFHSLGNDNGVLSYEYWFDSNYDSKEARSLNRGSNLFDIEVPALPQGIHYYNCRLGYSDGNWGPVYSKMFLNIHGGDNGNGNAVAYEYWLDNDYSSKTEGNLASGNNSYDIDLKGVRRGLHRFNYRLKTAEGVWGVPFTSYFYAESNPNKFSQYEYWLDNDYANRVTGNATGNPTSFEVDLSGFDKSGRAHYFNLRTRDGDGEWSPVYHKMLVFTTPDQKHPIISYRQFLNGKELGYVELERQFVDSYMFDVELPDSIYPSVQNRRPSFDGDRVFFAGGDSIDYVMQIRTELGWDAPKKWKLGISNAFSTTAVVMAINSRHTFAAPKDLEFAAMKFTANGDSLYFRSDIPVALDIYRDGEKTASLTPAQVKGMTMLRLEAGEYFGVLHNVEDAEAQNFTMHLMDTPNQVPMPIIEYKDEMVSISCSRQDAQIRYTLDGNEPDGESEPYGEAFPMKRNGTVKAKAWVEGSDIEPSATAEYTVDSYKVAAPEAEFDLPKRLLTLKSETKEAAILYTHEYDETDSIGGVWTDYTEPIQIRKNGTVYSRGVLDGYHDSEITVTQITTLPDSVPIPKIGFDEGIVTISCDEKDAEIHYTLDGTRPSAGSTRYQGAFPLRRNATVMAFAFVPGLDIDSSRVATHVVDTYKTATPKGSFDVKTRLLTLTCDTIGAAISYAFDPEGEWSAYSATEKIRMRKNGTVYAKASFDGYNDSDMATITVSELPEYVHQPEITCDGAIVDGKATVAIQCATDDAVIRYSFDDDELSMESPIYENPLTITRNTLVNAFAYVPDLDIDPSVVSSILCDVFRVEDLSHNFNPETRELTIDCPTEGATILYSFDPNGEWTEYTGPISIRKNCTLYAKAVRDGYHESATETITINSLADSVPVPVIEFKDGMVTIECPNKDAKIRYALDDAPLNMESTLYEGAFALTRNATIRAFAYIPDLDIEPSDPVTYIVDSYQVAKPSGSFDSVGRTLTISCATDGAKIFYSFEPREEWTPYGGPISITKNCIVYAYATFDGYKDSEVAEIAVTALANSVAAPVIDFADGKVTITCTTKDAEIHYTIDDDKLTADSPRYTAPFALDRNATIRAFAFIPGLDIEPSGITTEVVNSFKVAKPSGEFNAEKRELTISCATDKAKIYYSFDPERGWTEYSGPISITKNCTVYAKATRDGWNESDVSEIEVNELADSVAAPEIEFKDGTVTITCETDGAEIHYTIDSEDLTEKSPLYNGPFALDRNATIRAFALIPGLDIEPSGITTEVINSYKVATPYGRFDSETRMLTIICETKDASILYSYDRDGEWLPFSSPIAIEGNRTVYAKATRDGWNDSEVAPIVISDVKCDGVTFGDYDGRKVSLSTAENGATILYTTDGSEPSGANGQVYDGEFDAEGLRLIRAIAVKDGYMNSDESQLQITFYADEEHAETAAEGLLASAFEWNKELPGKLTDFRIKGRLNEVDYTFIRSMDALRHLDLEDVADAHIPAYAFDNSKLISISMPEDLAECGDSIFSGAPLLSSVIWNSRTLDVGDGLTRGLSNPNVLLYVPAETNVSGRPDLNIVREGVEPEVTLRYGYPYYAARDFRAARVSLTHDFRQTTAIDTCRGWETIVLPFSPTGIVHEVNGPAVPFAAWNEDIKGDKPFWLYRATASGWVPADLIEACIPYIISMPNNPDYVPEFNLGGKVTFSAEGVYLGPDWSLAMADSWIDGTRFEGTFMPMEEIGIPISSLNVGSDAGDYEPGSTFLPGGTTLPFGAYVSGAARKAIPLFGGSSSADMPLTADAGLLIETPAPGVLMICSGRERKVTVTTATGVTIRTLRLKPGEPVTMEGLTRDLYIVAGRKVMVR